MYDVGDVVPLGLSVTDADGVPAAGGAVVLTIGLPDGTSVTPPVTPGETGQYTVDYLAVMEGHHSVSWVVTGSNATAYSDVFNVREITEQLNSLASTKEQLGITTSVHDNRLRMFIAAAAVAIEDHTGHAIIRRTITERHRRVRGSLILKKTPALSITSVATVDGSVSWDPANLDLDPDTGIVDTMFGGSPCGNLLVVYLVGKRVIRANELLAGEIITEHLWQTMRSFVGAGAMASGALDDSLDARAGGLVGFAIPNRALELLGKPPPMVA